MTVVPFRRRQYRDRPKMSPVDPREWHDGDRRHWLPLLALAPWAVIALFVLAFCSHRGL